MDAYDKGTGAGPGTSPAPGAGEPGAAPAPDADGTSEAPGTPRTPGDLTALTLPYQLAAALVLALIVVVGAVHIGMVFLHVAPSNTASKQYDKAVDGWIYPEFEQNWKLFAPNPLQQNIAVHARAQVRTEDGQRRETGWINLSAQDGAAIDANLVPSHTQQNELRRAWDFYVGSHTSDNVSNGLRGDLSERYLRRIALLRFDREPLGGTVERIQLRSTTTNVQPPEWSGEKLDTRPSVRELPWWTVTSRDREVSDR
ncbi:DUF5819 family protein [Streptomyces indicus]|uniref:Uncharacterized protein n=1 Tax=Streptomyces indicus TaxID=417292 RepID=A0A1G9CQP9_9ACTN|nr:DUF5819 family protein [Streptomyces indicus]SDK53939.1 hypothetical protein SAMN05421806_108253 [Streptomyces indicus]